MTESARHFSFSLRQLLFRQTPLALLCLVASGITRVEGGESASSTSERVTAQPSPGWKPSYSYAVPGLEVLEFLPQGQALEDWRDVITVQNISRSGSESPAGLLREIAGRARSICLDVLSSPVNEHTESGYPAAAMSHFCPRDAQSRKGDVTLCRAIHGKDALYVPSRTGRDEAWDGRTIPLPEEALARWQEELGGFRVCRKGPAKRRCDRA